MNLNLKAVSAEDMLSKIQEINEDKANMANALANMVDGFRIPLSEEWASDAGDNYFEKFDRVIEEVNDSIEFVDRYMNDLTQAAQNYQTTEESEVNTDLVSPLSTDNIFDP